MKQSPWVPMSCLLATALTLTTAGCSGSPSTSRPPSGAVGSGAKGTPIAKPPFDETKGYLHRQSGVGFVYPEGWDIGKVKEQQKGAITSIDVDKDGGTIHVSLFWTLADTPFTAETVGRVEFEGLRGLYKDKLSSPEPITAGSQSGFKLSIQGGPLGNTNPDLMGVIYVFAVKPGQEWWKIKLRATVDKKDKLAQVEQLLAQYRW